MPNIIIFGLSVIVCIVFVVLHCHIAAAVWAGAATISLSVILSKIVEALDKLSRT